MKNRNTVLFIILFVLSMLGPSQFSHNVRAVDILGLFASGVLTGAASTLLDCFDFAQAPNPPLSLFPRDCAV